MISPLPSGLITLVYELLDAHHDTVELGADLAGDSWQAHLDYLRALQRKGREVLARLTANNHPGYPSEDALR
jgi:hypothetical protein